MTANEERQTAADLLIVHMLCQFGDEHPGPRAWLCRGAWVAYMFGRDFDFDTCVDEHLDWLNFPENAEQRAELAACCDYLKRIASKQPLWELPDNAFDPSEWFTHPTTQEAGR